MENDMELWNQLNVSVPENSYPSGAIVNLSGLDMTRQADIIGQVLGVKSDARMYKHSFDVANAEVIRLTAQVLMLERRIQELASEKKPSTES